MHRGANVAIVLAGFVVACTDVRLFEPRRVPDIVEDNKVSVSGSLCAEPPSAVEAFLKILFIVDRSNSMNVTDANNRRISAAQEAVLRFIDDTRTYRLRTGVQIALVSFYGDVVTHTRDSRGLPGFSTDGPAILRALTELARTGSNTSYDKTLFQTFLLLDRDMARLQDVAKARSRYEVVFLSDGMPFPDNCRGEPNSPTAAVQAVSRIAGLSAVHGIKVSFHTAFASDPRMFTADDVDACRDNSDDFESRYDTLGDETHALLQAMAEKGNGTFVHFQNGDAINFMDFEIADSTRTYALQDFVVSNINAIPHQRGVLPDSDGDGLGDADEVLLGTRAALSDSDGDGFRDALEWRLRSSGFDPLDPTDALCEPLERNDTDGDAILDCEETVFGTRRRSIDSDNDGLPDLLEVLSGTDPSSANVRVDLQLDSDGDGGSDADEVRWHTDPHANDVAVRAEMSYDVRLAQLPISSGNTCYRFDVRNISLASTQAVTALETGGAGTPVRAGRNRVMLYASETAQDGSNDEALHRVACVEARYVAERDLKIPANGHLDIPARRPSDSWSPTDVLRPSGALCQAAVNQDCGVSSLWCRFESNGTCACYRPPLQPGDPLDGTYDGPCRACSNGVDDDGDGLTDFPFDPDCFDGADDDETTSTACSNGVDDDADGRSDWPYDSGCDSSLDTDEADAAVQSACSDGIDNDNDGSVDFPATAFERASGRAFDPDCFAANDNDESGHQGSAVYACSDGVDNDGDGRADFGVGADAGCQSAQDVDESGPSVCFFCSTVADLAPGQCAMDVGYCKPRSGMLTGGTACTTREECRGAPCKSGVCSPCLRDSDCQAGTDGPQGYCDTRHGWCLSASVTVQSCQADADCPAGGRCDQDVRTCRVDPYFRCRDERDCAPDELCSAERGFCLRERFTVEPCGDGRSCAAGACDSNSGWCIPNDESQQCRHDDLCPYGSCTTHGYCDQSTFVPPEQLDMERDCVTER